MDVRYGLGQTRGQRKRGVVKDTGALKVTTQEAIVVIRPHGETVDY